MFLIFSATHSNINENLLLLNSNLLDGMSCANKSLSLKGLNDQLGDKKMATKKKGLMTSSGEWAKHLRKFNKRKFWKNERQEEKELVKEERVGFVCNKFDSTEWTWTD